MASKVAIDLGFGAGARLACRTRRYGSVMGILKGVGAADPAPGTGEHFNP
jgi:hypothetical protein